MDKGQIKSEAFWNPDVFTYLLMPDHYKAGNFYASQGPRLLDVEVRRDEVTIVCSPVEAIAPIGRTYGLCLHLPVALSVGR